MFKFAAIIWNPREGATPAVEHAARVLTTGHSAYRSCYSGPGCKVFCIARSPNTMRSHLLDGRKGLVVGRLFHRHSHREVTSVIESDEIGRILSGAGHHFIKAYWGNYVAIFDTTGGTHIVKDPTGSLPCYYLEQPEFVLVFSCLSTPHALGIPLSPNETYIRARLFRGSMIAGVAPFHGVRRLHGGECLIVEQNRSLRTRLYWTPRDFRPEADMSIGESRAKLSEVVRSCTSAWLTQAEPALHRLSGGLDSSIVLACLTGSLAQPDVLSYTYFQDHIDNDERPWARLAAQAAECKHLEWQLDPLSIDLSIGMSMPAAVEPLSVLPYYQRTAIETPLAAQHGARVVFNGDGGDSGFGGDSIHEAVAESLHYRGVRIGLLRLAHLVAMRSKRSTIEVLTSALRDRHGVAPERITHMTTRAVARDLREEEPPAVRHPWFEGHGPADRFIIPRLGGLLATPRFYDHAGEAPDVISPLYSQPVIETLLRIPVEHLFVDGRERGLARQAFEADVPPQILDRLWKDRAPTFVEKLVSTNRRWLREVLLDGILARAGWLDRKAVELALSTHAMAASPIYSAELLKHLDTEIWLQTSRLSHQESSDPPLRPDAELASPDTGQASEVQCLPAH